MMSCGWNLLRFSLRCTTSSRGSWSDFLASSTPFLQRWRRSETLSRRRSKSTETHWIPALPETSSTASWSEVKRSGRRGRFPVSINQKQHRKFYFWHLFPSKRLCVLNLTLEILPLLSYYLDFILVILPVYFQTINFYSENILTLFSNNFMLIILLIYSQDITTL